MREHLYRRDSAWFHKAAAERMTMHDLPYAIRRWPCANAQGQTHQHQIWHRNAEGQWLPHSRPCVSRSPVAPRAMREELRALNEQAWWDGAEGYRHGRRYG